MDIKRNIFQSNTKMPSRYESSGSAVLWDDPSETLPFVRKTDNNVRHAPCPRVGEQK